MIIDLPELNPVLRQNFLQYAIAPRPICFASTIDLKGRVNLSPFSFFNLFSTTPPVVIFSPSRRVRNNTVKHTLENVQEVPEVVINIVDDEMIHQASLASCDFPKEVNEFSKAGFTPEPATLVKPPMVKESPVKMECRVDEIKVLGTTGGSGNLVICTVLRMHIDDSILDGSGMIDQQKIRHVARLGGDWYCRVDPVNLFQVEKANVHIGIGVDALPPSIRNSATLTGKNLAQLGNIHELPVIDPGFDDQQLTRIFQYYSMAPDEMEKELHRYAKQLLDAGQTQEAWQVLLAMQEI